eukprot:scaffold124021_cov19-Tisochrysis_lutea.AAC.4
MEEAGVVDFQGYLDLWSGFCLSEPGWGVLGANVMVTADGCGRTRGPSNSCTSWRNAAVGRKCFGSSH